MKIWMLIVLPSNRNPQAGRTKKWWTQTTKLFQKILLENFNLFWCIRPLEILNRKKCDKKLWQIQRKRFQVGTRIVIQLSAEPLMTKAQLQAEAEFISLLWSIKLFQKIEIFTVFYYLYLKLCLMKIINKYKL